MPAVFEARKRGFNEVIDVTKMQIPFLSSAVGATRKTLAERPELGEPYLRALAQAGSRLKTDREYGIEIMGKYAQNDDRELLGQTVDYYAPIWLELFPWAREPWRDTCSLPTVPFQWPLLWSRRAAQHFLRLGAKCPQFFLMCRGQLLVLAVRQHREIQDPL